MSDKLFTLFELLCDDFTDRLKNGEMNSADRKILIEFLKDQGVSASKNNNHIKNILEGLPFQDEEEDVTSYN